MGEGSVMAIDNIYDKGIESGWSVIDGQSLLKDQTIEADVVVVGSGAGGATSANIFAEAGLKVLILEAGSLNTSDHFKELDEARAYAELYQEGGGRATSDGAVAIFQGRTVGGSTTVNWTTSLRTPDNTLHHWEQVHGVSGLNGKTLAPWFEQNEAALNISPWAAPANKNNAALASGCESLGYNYAVIPRNVKGCWDLGYCGLGCPTNAKQSMLVTRIPAALQKGATLIHRIKAERIEHDGEKVTSLLARPLKADAKTPTGAKLTIKAKHYVLAGGAMNNPALMLRSELPDPYRTLGARTTIHPVNVSLGMMGKKVDGFWGAPQSVYSDEFLWNDAADEMGYKLEAAPVLPGLTSMSFGGKGQILTERMTRLPEAQQMLALMRDGFHEQSPGGQVSIDSSGSPVLDYELSDFTMDGLRRAFLSMAEIQFAAGAKSVIPSHLEASEYNSWDAAKAAINDFEYRKFKVTLFSAHVMGGCAMGDDPRISVVNSAGGHHQLSGLSVLDGSLFPTSLGVNPQLSIYAITSKLATELALKLG
jgi:choline dehydrogenase-like flavoprotein